MTQRIFDVENEKDMADLWDILSEEVIEIKKQAYGPSFKYYGDNNNVVSITSIININWHDKTEITRPIEEATEQDFGKICVFWNFAERPSVSILAGFNDDTESEYPFVASEKKYEPYRHCRRLTKQEIEELI